MTPGDERHVLLAEYGWSPETLDIWLRAGCKCEVCHRDLLASVDDYFYGAEIDHLHPVSRNGADDGWNRALLCRMCNRLKRNTEVCDPTLGLPREDVVERARALIMAIRDKRQAQLEAARLLLTTIMQAGQGTTAVSSPGPAA
jgi:hypothetical protein